MLTYFIFGFFVGVGGSFAYLTLGDMGFFWPNSTWATVVFFPGLWTGHVCYGVWGQMLPTADLAVNVCIAIGLCTNGLVCGALACLLCLPERLERGPERDDGPPAQT